MNEQCWIYEYSPEEITDHELAMNANAETE